MTGGFTSLWIGLDEALADASDPNAALTVVFQSFVRVARSWLTTLDDTVNEVDTMTEAQREYVAELVALLRDANPVLSHREARLRIQIALIVVADLYRNRALSGEADFQQNATVLMAAIARQ